jgi:hypothetical protein
MASTRTPGITIDSDGHRFLDKRYHGIRIGMRVGSVTLGAGRTAPANGDPTRRSRTS